MHISQESICVEVFFNKVAGPQNCNFIKKRLQHRFFPMNFAKSSPVAASDSFRFPVCNFIKKGLWQRCFSVNLAKFLRTSFDRTPPDDCFLCLYVNFEKFFRTPLFCRATLGNCLLHVQVAEFKPPDIIKDYFTDAFQAFCTRMRNSHLKALIYKAFEGVKIPENYL